MDAKARLVWTADLADLVTKINSIPGLTKSATNKAQVEAVKEFSKLSSGVGAAADEAGKKIGNNLSGGIRTAGKALRIFGSELSGRKWAGAAQAFASIGGSAGIAALGVAAVGSAFVGAAVGLDKLVHSAGKWAKELSAFPELDLGLQQQHIDGAVAGLDSMKVSAKALGLVLISQLGPAIYDISVRVVAWELYFTESAKNVKIAMRGLADWLATQWFRGATIWLTGPIRALALGLEKLSGLVGLNDIAAGFANFGDQMDRATEKVGHFIGGVAVGGIEGLASSMGDLTTIDATYVQKAAALIDSVAKQAKGVDELTDAENRNRKAKELKAKVTVGPEYQVTKNPEYRVTELNAQVKTTGDVITGVADKIGGVMKDMSGGLSSLVGIIGGPVAGAIAAVIEDAGGAIKGLLDTLTNIPSLLKSLPRILTRAVRAILTEIVPAIVEALPIFLKRVVGMVPQIIEAVVDGLPKIIKALVSMVPEIIIALVKEIPTLVKALVMAQYEIAWALGKAMVQVIVDSIKEITTLGLAHTETYNGPKGGPKGDTSTSKDKPVREASRSYGDTPGVIYSPSPSMIRLAAGDFMAAAKRPADLLSQAMQAVIPQQPAMATAGGASYRDVHRQHDLFLRDHLRQDSTLRRSLGIKTGRLNPWG